MTAIDFNFHVINGLLVQSVRLYGSFWNS